MTTGQQRTQTERESEREKDMLMCEVKQQACSMQHVARS